MGKDRDHLSGPTRKGQVTEKISIFSTMETAHLSTKWWTDRYGESLESRACIGSGWWCKNQQIQKIRLGNPEPLHRAGSGRRASGFRCQELYFGCRGWIPRWWQNFSMPKPTRDGVRASGVGFEVSGFGCQGWDTEMVASSASIESRACRSMIVYLR